MYKLGVIGLGTRIHKGVLPALAGYSSELCITAAADHDAEKVRKPERFFRRSILTTPVLHDIISPQGKRFPRDIRHILQKKQGQ